MNKIRARLTINGIGEMDKKELRFFRKWINMVATELNKTEPQAFNQKKCRFTLYAQDTI